jgi:hypothetical protein
VSSIGARYTGMKTLPENYMEAAASLPQNFAQNIDVCVNVNNEMRPVIK